MGRPRIPKHLKRSVAVYVLLRPGELLQVDAVRTRHRTRPQSRAAVLREALLRYLPEAQRARRARAS